jgi:hypothetical protein
MERLKILIAGMVAGDPRQGGASWAVLQYVAGLAGLGHEVMLVEPVSRQSLRPRGEVVRYFRSLPLLGGRAALLAVDGAQTVGLSFTELAAFAREADVLLNLSGLLRDERLLGPIPVRAFVDLDPGFNQVWAASGEDMGFDLHTHFITVGCLLGSRECAVPPCGRSWVPSLPPVALKQWPRDREAPRRRAFTSIGNWRSYGSIEHGGVRYGQRAHSLRELFDLPRRVETDLELALSIHPDEKRDLQALRRNGWRLLDPVVHAGTPFAYGEFIRASKGELCVAKSGYVASRSGWFSDRSACYLASGRPVVAQETGFSKRLPTGEGLLAFATAAEAADALAAVEANPGRHQDAARALAEEHLDARKVLTRLLERLGGSGEAADRR